MIEIELLLIRCKNCGRILAVWKDVDGMAVPVPVAEINGEYYEIEWMPKQIKGTCKCGNYFVKTGFVTPYKILLERIKKNAAHNKNT